MPLILYDIYHFLLVGTTLLGILNYRNNNLPTNIFVASLIITSISEVIAYKLALERKNNLLLYHIYTPIQFFFLCLYFNIIISFFRRIYAGYIIGISAIVLSVLNTIFLQHPKTSYNTNFLAIESLLVVGMTLCYYYDYLSKPITSKHITSPEFWITCLLLTYWSFTYLRWLVETTVPSLITANAIIIQYMMWSINIFTYSGFAIIFLFYRKQKVSVRS